MLWERDPDEAMVQAADHLLDQSQFGERWGRHWLDVTRFAESTGAASISRTLMLGDTETMSSIL